MRRSTRLAISLGAVLSTGGALAQAPEALSVASVTASAAAPVAHVYVANASHVYAFSAAANGKLTPVPGSPFGASLSWMAVNGHYLFGTQGTGTTIASFSMASNGALHKVASLNTANFGSNNCVSSIAPVQFRIDHSGLNLYSAEVLNENFCSTVFQSFRINNANGALTFLGDTAKYLEGGADIGVLGNNQYAYAPECTNVDGNQFGAILGFKRQANGELVELSTGIPLPSPPQVPSTYSPPGLYCPLPVATDPTNHLAVILLPLDQDGDLYAPAVLATYTADANGRLSTTSTYQNMATLPMVRPPGSADETCLACAALRMAPSGKLLAAGGTGGVEIYHFNGAGPITKYKALLPGFSVTQIFWDNNNHMYAIGTNSAGAGKLYVYTITPTSVTEAPGSPYSITSPGSMAVQPL
jgi:hypothetical protein